MEQHIKIFYPLNNYVYQLFFEYNNILNVLQYLQYTKNPNIYKYYEKAIQKYMELEFAKAQVSNAYKPNKEINNYKFDFDACELIYYGD